MTTISTFLPSPFWFILTGAFAVFSVILFISCAVVSCDYNTGAKYDSIKYLLWPAIVMFMVWPFTLAFGFKAPDHFHYCTVPAEVLQNIVSQYVEANSDCVKESIKAYLNGLTAEDRYQLLLSKDEAKEVSR